MFKKKKCNLLLKFLNYPILVLLLLLILILKLHITNFICDMYFTYFNHYTIKNVWLYNSYILKKHCVVNAVIVPNLYMFYM